MPGSDPQTQLGYTSNKEMSQDFLIPMINRILEKGGVKLTANDDGICNGLAAVYIKYALQGKSSEFAAMLNAINQRGQQAIMEGINESPLPSTSSDSEISDSDINRFIQEVVFCFLPDEFNKQLSQVDAVHLVTVPVEKHIENPDGNVTQVSEPQKLQSVYKLGLVAEKGAWKQIFNKMRAPDTAWHVGSLDHAVAVHVNKEGNFEVYDPNYRKIAVFKDGHPKPESTAAGQLENFLFRRFAMETNKMALTIDVVAHPQAAIDFNFPDKASFIIDNLSRRYPDVKNDALKNSKGAPYNQLAMAARINDTEMLKLWLEKGSSSSHVALLAAVQDNRLDSLEVLLENQYRHCLNDPENSPLSAYYDAVKVALKKGRTESLGKLLNDHDIRLSISQLLQNNAQGTEFQLELLSNAAKSRNPYCIRILTDFLKDNVPDLDFAQLINSGNVLEIAREAGNPQCVQILKNLVAEKPGIAQDSANDLNSAEDEMPAYPSNEEEVKHFIWRLPSFREVISMIVDKIASFFRSSKAETDSSTQKYKTQIDEVKSVTPLSDAPAATSQSIKSRLSIEKASNEEVSEASSFLSKPSG
ncbi:hypothetical protein [Legionella quinlivanii]|uniref:hypothetical protein n=1 Tax=Legionella quinlivanii TaxID=45073 RepID=UPI002244F166|nr:hypothetical protein [Legionella quinlivanii]MCW8450542.1 hypothetical protein [Legionella quinlivanii]